MISGKKILLVTALLSVLSGILPVCAQDTSLLRTDVEFLASDICAGRKTGTAGSSEAASYIARRFEQNGLLKMSPSGYTMSFSSHGSYAGRNVIGMKAGWGDKCIVIAAHYDNLGILEGNVYPGADSNASGVAMLLSLIPELSLINYPPNIIFVALDSYQTMSGAQDLLKRIDSGMLVNPNTGKTITRKSISLFVNLDQIGSSLSPIHEGRGDYLIMLGAEKTRNLLTSLNIDGLDIAFDYYGSASFTDMFLNRVGDQRVFKDAGIPVAVFTSGITMLTNKREDTADSLDYDVMAKRFVLLYHYFDHALPVL